MLHVRTQPCVAGCRVYPGVCREEGVVGWCIPGWEGGSTLRRVVLPSLEETGMTLRRVMPLLPEKEIILRREALRALLMSELLIRAREALGASFSQNC